MFHLLLGACTTESPLGHDLGALTIEVDPALPNVVHVAWTGVPGKSRVAYGLDGVLDRTTSTARWPRRPRWR